VTPEHAARAKLAVFKGAHKLPVIQKRGLSSVGVGGAAADVVTDSPLDLSYFGGTVLRKAVSWNVYVNCETTPAECWGTGSLSPATFLRDLNHSKFLNIVSEYTHTPARDDFTVRELSTQTEFADGPPTVDDIFGIIAGALEQTHGAAGYGNIYHVFLPQGTDMCIDDFTCYSPDDPDTFVFCAFHGSVDFDANTHVLFSVEPYQGTPGCQFPGQTPHGVIDATASTLSHELIETITDPDLDAWFNAFFGYEIADICFAFSSNLNLNGHKYQIQSEYSNRRHSCTNSA
jgi:hypothetical protein